MIAELTSENFRQAISRPGMRLVLFHSPSESSSFPHAVRALEEFAQFQVADCPLGVVNLETQLELA
ncbi:MAG: hypothetical protein N2C14_03810, partial [Planctomycetales bacterium]